MNRKTRLVVLFATLAAVGAWVAFGDEERASGEVVAAAAPKAAVTPEVTLASAGPSAEEASDMPARPSLDEMGADPFNVEGPKQAAPEAAPPPAPVVHSAPPPPPLPYRFAGRLHVGDAVEVYLAKGDEVIEVKKGDKLDGGYRVERIGRTEMTLRHIASGAREKLEYAPPINESEAAVSAAPARAQRRDYGSLHKTERGG